jgi:hypothetical protein
MFVPRARPSFAVAVCFGLVPSAFSRDDAENQTEEGTMRSVASHVAMLLVGVILATAAGATAHPAKQTDLASRLARLEFRHNLLQRRYQGVCDTLKFTRHTDIQDLQVRGMFIQLAAIC